ncbi:MAG: hypothetical protein GKR86_00270 [Ilumatobacter sp.]|nr:hypothetical protein [Ilumatobacter sp.]
MSKFKKNSQNIVRIRRNRLSDEYATLSMDRINELLDHIGGRQELTYVVNKQLEMLEVAERVHPQEITNCLYKKKVVPQLAVRIETALSDMEGFEHYTKEYFCPDLNKTQFEMVIKSMDFDNV